MEIAVREMISSARSNLRQIIITDTSVKEALLNEAKEELLNAYDEACAKYIDKKILIFADKFTDFFVKCKRKLDFLREMIYAYRHAERKRERLFPAHPPQNGKKRSGWKTG